MIRGVDAGGRRAAAAGAHRRGPDVPARASSEIIAGRAIANGFQGAGVGETMRFASRDWTVVGVFDAGRTGFDSEIWGDAEQMLQAFRRLAFSSLIFRLADADRFDAVKARLESDPRLTLEAKRETRFYAEQSEALAKFISYLGTTISVIFSIGAIIGAMITMYASVASRTGGDRHAARARLLPRGDPRRVPRRGAAARARRRRRRARGRLVHAGGLDLDDELPDLRRARVPLHADAGASSSASLLFALAMGFVGGFLPAARAARMKIVDALRAA